ncbi:MFS transporter [Microbacterium terricola]|uniref:MFS transporter n=1 Tax=Microbacterium terricola TaxID=344163 RepID=A0ABM8E3I3_9MICO|nr:MFS transporter [Microbacterium terricola]UYK39967.1 MFS transporter [Microbacterium terricola]BDV32349.1 MFS transporter [Microbacterium terricola]
MKRWFVLIILGVSQFVMVLDSTVMNVSISTVASDLGTDIGGMQAAITFYALTMAAFMLTGGKLGDKWGRSRAFRIGSVVYGLGSLATAFAPNLTVLLLGWSLVEGLGAVLVIPAIAALAAINYAGRERVIAFSALGAITGFAAAAGPLIGGLMTTYASWRYVFVGEAIVMALVLIVSGRVKDLPGDKTLRIDFLSVVLSASGMAILVFAVLQSKTWGWLVPLNPPEIAGTTIAPFGISPVAYLILIAILVLRWFVSRQVHLERIGRVPLLKVSLLRIPALRSGLTMFLAQYFAIAALFFVVPVYLQTILGYNALETGLKILPLSAGLIVFSVIGSRMSTVRSARNIARIGQFTLGVGLLLIFVAVQPDLADWLFATGMFVVGAGFGLLASQLGNVNMTAVSKDDTSEVGGLQGTFQNLGSSFGTAIVGSVFILLLTSGFGAALQSSDALSADIKEQVAAATADGAPIISEKQAEQAMRDAGATAEEAAEVAQTYADTQLEALRQALFVVFALTLIAIVLARGLPATIPVPASAEASDDPGDGERTDQVAGT